MPGAFGGDDPSFARGNEVYRERVRKELRASVTSGGERVIAGSSPNTNGFTRIQQLPVTPRLATPAYTPQFSNNAHVTYVSNCMPRRLAKEGIFSQRETVFGSPLNNSTLGLARQAMGSNDRAPSFGSSVRSSPFVSWHGVQSVHVGVGVNPTAATACPWQLLSAQQKWCGHV